MNIRIGHMQETLHHGTYGVIIDTYYTLRNKITFIGLAWKYHTFGITLYKKRIDNN